MKALVVGLGSIGRRHAALLVDNSAINEVIAYRSSDEPIGVEGVTEVFDFEQVLADTPDMAFVTNPTGMHVETAIRCAEAGCHLFIEKPLSDSLEGVERLCELVERKNLITMMGCQLRFDPILLSIKDRLERGEIGEVLSFTAVAGSYLPDWRPGRDYRQTYSASMELGGGVVLDLIHELDYVHWLFGEVTTTRAIVDRVSHLDIETEDLAEIACRTRSGVVGHVHLDYFRPSPRRDLEVVGSTGVIEADLECQTLAMDKPDDAWTEQFDYERNDRLRSQLEYFLDHVTTNESCENDLQTGRRVLQTALEVKEEFDER